MKANFKPLALATAVAAVTAGYTGVTQAEHFFNDPETGVVTPIPQFAGTSSLGDAAIVPYYTVNGDFVTGVHITNTSPTRTQVVKLRYRRAMDSMDALDFNIILSPRDEWTGSLGLDGDTIRVFTDDNSCTAPQLEAAVPGPGTIAPMGDIFRAGAEEGYIEIIGMASIGKDSAMAVAALHATTGATKGLPLDCDAVESNFFRQATVHPLVPDLIGRSNNGVYSSDRTVQTCTEDVLLGLDGPGTRGCAIDGGDSGPNSDFLNRFDDAGNVLKVSWFIRSLDSGTEFGGNAVHIANLSNVPMMSNQEIIITNEVDYYSFLFPDLDGGSPSPCENPWEGQNIGDPIPEDGIIYDDCLWNDPEFDGVIEQNQRGRYNGVRQALGAEAIVNDWSNNTANGVSTDWIITLPGQYLMLNIPPYLDSLDSDAISCENFGSAAKLNLGPIKPDPLVPVCDARDLPVSVDFITLDREEAGFTNPEGGLVISPETTDKATTALLENEVNVIEWTDGTNAPVLDSNWVTSLNTAALGSPFGWAEVAVTSNDGVQGKKIGIANAAIMEFALPSFALDPFDYDVIRDVPIVGFAAWERTFASDPGANYSRAIDHSYKGVTSLDN